MNKRLVPCLFAVLAATAFAILPEPIGFTQHRAPDALDFELQLLISDDAGYNELSAASRELASRGAEAVPLLVKQLPTSSDLAKLRILGTLSRIGPAGAPALPEVRRLLREGSPPVRAASADLVRALGVAGREALPDLFRSLDDLDEITVGTAARAIDALDPDFFSKRLADLLDRFGTSPISVDRLRLSAWHCIASRSAADADLARDLLHWMLVIGYTGRGELLIGEVLRPEEL